MTPRCGNPRRCLAWALRAILRPGRGRNGDDSQQRDTHENVQTADRHSHSDLSPDSVKRVDGCPRYGLRPGGREHGACWEADESTIANFRSEIDHSGFPDSPAVVAAIQAAHIHPSTPGRRPVELAEKAADAVREDANGVRKAHAHAVSAVAGTGPPLSTEIHFWTAAPRMMTASTIMTTVQMVRIQPSMLRAALAPTASG